MHLAFRPNPSLTWDMLQPSATLKDKHLQIMDGHLHDFDIYNCSIITATILLYMLLIPRGEKHVTSVSRLGVCPLS